MKFRCRFYLAIVAILAAALPVGAQDQDVPEDNVLRLLQAEEARQISEYGVNRRIVKGNARFLHNDTYLLCDSASWNVEGKFIEAFGNVQIIQNNTLLKSEELVYFIDQNLAKFRGGVVELLDKDGNILRTSQLDYNTKDSVANFMYGGAVKDTSGNVIESREGTYDSKIKTFTFRNNVELYMDSIELKTSELRYLAEYSKAYFNGNNFLWRGTGFLKSESGWYERGSGASYFADDVYMNDPQYEAWTDEVYYDQKTGKVDMYANSQILDTLHKSSYMGNHMIYEPAPSDTADKWSERVILERDPAIVYRGENENHQPDTLYMRGDTIKVISMLPEFIPQSEFDEGKKRVEDMEFDALAKTRKEQAEEREKKRIDALREAGKLPPEHLYGADEKAGTKAAADSSAHSALDSMAVLDSIPKPVADSAAVSGSISHPVADSAAVLDSIPQPVADTSAMLPMQPDSLSVPLDSLSVPVDSNVVKAEPVPIRFIYAYRNAKAFRSDVQACCDSMVFCEIDSVARLYGKPVLWNAVKNQLTGETMHLLMKNGNIYRGSMITDAWVISQEDSLHFHQIKSTEMLGYFYNNQLYRFDALGGVNAVFYLAENADITTINIKEAKTMTAMIKDGNAKRLLYMESIKSDAYPIGELVLEKQRLKGFTWRGEQRPKGKSDITSIEVKETSRDKYRNVKKPVYSETNKYFDNYMAVIVGRSDRFVHQIEE